MAVIIQYLLQNVKNDTKYKKRGDNMRRDGSTYYPVLEHEIILRNITKKEMREFLDIEQSSFVLKLNGARRFSLEEAIRLQEEFFPDVTVNELFRHE